MATRWITQAVDTLAKERDELMTSMLIMSDMLTKIPCEAKLYLAYEWILQRPEPASAVLAQFLRVPVNDPDLIAWKHQIKAPGNPSTPWPGPYKVVCADATLGKKLLQWPWPDDWPKQCDTARGCLREFRKHVTSWFYQQGASTWFDARGIPRHRAELAMASLVPMRPMSQCLGG